MAEIFKNIKGIHYNGAASITVGVNDDEQFIISKDASKNSVSIKSPDNSLSSLNVEQVSINSDPTEDNQAATKKYVDTHTSVTDASPDTAGLMTPEQFVKLRDIEEGANKTVVDDALNSDSTNPVQNKVLKTVIEDAKKTGTDARDRIDTHLYDKDNPHSVTAEQVGLGNVTNESKATMFTSPELTGIPTAPTAASGTKTTQIATTEFVQAEMEKKIAAADAMIFKGTIGDSGADVTSLPDTHKIGWSYKVATAGTYAGHKCEIGDMIICLVEGTEANDADWSVVQTNIDGAVIGPTSSVNNHVAVFNGSTGKLITDSGFTIETSVPADAKFTDTTYSDVSSSQSGLMTPDLLNKLNGITDSADAVSFSQIVSSGTKIGTITINGETYDVFAPIQDSIEGNAATATQATHDSKGQNIADTYIKGLSFEDNTFTITYGNDETADFYVQHTDYTLESFGVTAAPSELNYISGATGNIQEQLDDKVSSRDFTEHTENKNNPHNVTAEQVGARPDTWMPTVDDIGADESGAAEKALEDAKKYTDEQISASGISGIETILNQFSDTGFKLTDTITGKKFIVEVQNGTLVSAIAPENSGGAQSIGAIITQISETGIKIVDTVTGQKFVIEIHDGSLITRLDQSST